MEHINIHEEQYLSPKEENLIKYILTKYNFEARNIYKLKNLYKIDSSIGIVCLKKLRHGEKRILNGNLLIENLHKSGFDNIFKFIRTKEGDLYIKNHKSVFYVMEWIDGDQRSLDSLMDAVLFAQTLAKFHITMNHHETRGFKIKNNIKDWPKIFFNNLLNLEKYKYVIEKKRIKNEFDIIFSHNIDNFYNRGQIALKILNDSNYFKLAKEASIRKSICINNLKSDNIRKKNEKYYINSLDDIVIDVQIVELAKLIRKLMFRKSLNWNFDKAKYIIETYSEIKPLSKEELQILLAIVIFPYKFWKLGKKRYIKQKGWSEPKYMHKLERLVESNELEEKFLYDYINYLNLDNRLHSD